MPSIHANDFEKQASKSNDNESSANKSPEGEKLSANNDSKPSRPSTSSSIQSTKPVKPTDFLKNNEAFLNTNDGHPISPIINKKGKASVNPSTPEVKGSSTLKNAQRPGYPKVHNNVIGVKNRSGSYATGSTTSNKPNTQKTSTTGTNIRLGENMSFTLGDPVLPINNGVSSMFTKREDFPLVILSTPAPFHCYVDKIHYFNMNPKEQKISVNSFFVHTQDHTFSSSYEAEKPSGPSSFANVPENTAMTMLCLEVTPPLLVRKGFNIGIYDQANGTIQAVSSLRRVLSSEQHGFYVGDRYHFEDKRLPLVNYLRYATTFCVTIRRLSEEEKNEIRKNVSAGAAVINYASREEYRQKLLLLLKGPPVDTEEILLETCD